MATAVIMPRQGQSVETCIITKWFKTKGDKVDAGDLLFSYETDKAAFDMEAPAGGYLLDIFYTEGSEVPVLSNVAVIGAQGEPTAAFGGAATEAEPSREGQADAGQKADITADNGTLDLDLAPDQSEKRIRISPRARMLAAEKGTDISRIMGTGPNGRIIVSDIENAATGFDTGSASVKTGEAYSDVPLSNVRKLIAKAMHASLQNSAQLTHHMSADARRILEARKTVKERISAGSEKQDITLNDIICWCVLRALEKFPELNSHFLGDTIRTFSGINLGIAVDTQRGLMVPAVVNAGKMNIRQLAAELKSVADSGRKGSIDPGLIRSDAASFTVSNLGNYGVEMFTPVINLPQVAILGVCTITYRPADLGNNTFGFVPFIGLSLTYDHRAVDGGPATLFLKEIKEQIQNFSL